MATQPIDPQTNRPVGDHGTANDAIDFALEHDSASLQEAEFLSAWREGDLQEWPEFYEWLGNVEKRRVN